MRSGRIKIMALTSLVVLFLIARVAVAQTPSPALLVLEKDGRSLAIVDPDSLKIVGRVAAGEGPHELAVTDEGTFAYISNYGAFSNPQYTLSVVDLVAQKALPVVDLGALRAPSSASSK